MKKLFLLFCLLPAVGCEVLETDISDKRVPIVSPADNAVVTAGRTGFRWKALPHTEGYEFRLVSPSFTKAERVAADSVFRADSLDRGFGCEIELSEGEYEWSITGFNSGYETRTDIRRLTVVAPEEAENPIRNSGEPPTSEKSES